MRNIAAAACAACALLGFCSISAAETPTPAPELARETLTLLASLNTTLAVAVRQRDARSGRADFSRFVIDPITKMGGRWAALPQPTRVDWIQCIGALQGFENHARDSFKAGVIGTMPASVVDSRNGCAKQAGY